VSKPASDNAPVTVYKTLIDMPEFYNANGVFIVQSPRTITICQGDGKSASVTLYADDTMYDVAKRINNTIAYSLGQALYINDEGINNFCAIADGTPLTSESVAGKTPLYYGDDDIIGYREYTTMLVRSAIPGVAGELHFIGSEELLQALGLNTIQESRESEFIISVYDAHSGELVNPHQKVSGNILYRAITDNIDVKFDPMANMSVVWNENTKSYKLNRDSDIYTTVVHIADNTTTLQIGANEGEDMALFFGNMGTSALGIDVLLVASRELAARSITKIDNAIDRVSRQRSMLGAYQNRLEHTITNLTTTSENTTASESRIRDTDMAKEMMNFTKLNILIQSGMSMLGQANQLPQNVLSLLR
jgi:flagellin